MDEDHDDRRRSTLSRSDSWDFVPAYRNEENGYINSNSTDQTVSLWKDSKGPNKAKVKTKSRHHSGFNCIFLTRTFSRLKKSFLKLVLLSALLTSFTILCARSLSAGQASKIQDSRRGFLPLTKLLSSSHRPSLEKRKRFPSCIIFGVSKCGTRAIAEYITLHPDVFEPHHELNFFVNSSLLAKGLDWYKQQMPEILPHQMTVEKSPDYFQSYGSIELIRSTNPNVKLVLLLREPVERVVSEYTQIKAKFPKSMVPFEKWAINNVTGQVSTKTPSIMVSAYVEHLQHWLDAFPRNQFHVIESDSLRYSPYKEVKRLETFLKLKPYFVPEDFYFNNTRKFFCMRNRQLGNKTRCLGKSKGMEHIVANELVLAKLRKFYEPYNARLSEALGMRFPWSSTT